MDERNLTERGIDNSLEGKGENLKGRVKDALGGLTGDSKLQGEGKMDQLKGKVQDKVGEMQRDLDRPNRDGL
jgi:uncharacterized protein YjbJ (UPF0337 family)